MADTVTPQAIRFVNAIVAFFTRARPIDAASQYKAMIINNNLGKFTYTLEPLVNSDRLLTSTTTEYNNLRSSITSGSTPYTIYDGVGRVAYVYNGTTWSAANSALFLSDIKPERYYFNMLNNRLYYVDGVGAAARIMFNQTPP